MFSYLNFIINTLNFGFGCFYGVWKKVTWFFEAVLALRVLWCLLGLLRSSVILQVSFFSALGIRGSHSNLWLWLVVRLSIHIILHMIQIHGWINILWRASVLKNCLYLLQCLLLLHMGVPKPLEHLSLKYLKFAGLLVFFNYQFVFFLYHFVLQLLLLLHPIDQELFVLDLLGLRHDLLLESLLLRSPQVFLLVLWGHFAELHWLHFYLLGILFFLLLSHHDLNSGILFLTTLLDDEASSLGKVILFLLHSFPRILLLL